MNGNAVVLVCTASLDVGEVTFLLLKVETSGVGQEDVGEDKAQDAEPGDDVEAGLSIDVVVDDGRGEGTKLAAGSGEAVC